MTEWNSLSDGEYLMLVENNASDTMLTEKLLRDQGFSFPILTFHDSEAAIDFLCRRGAYEGRRRPFPRVIVLGLFLPKLDGFDLLSIIRNFSETSRVPIVVFSGSVSQADFERAEELGANLILGKPSEYDALGKAVGQIRDFWGRVQR